MAQEVSAMGQEHTNAMPGLSRVCVHLLCVTVYVVCVYVCVCVCVCVCVLGLVPITS